MSVWWGFFFRVAKRYSESIRYCLIKTKKIMESPLFVSHAHDGTEWIVVSVNNSTRVQLRRRRDEKPYCEHRPPLVDALLWLQQPRGKMQSMCVLCEPIREFLGNDPIGSHGEVYVWPTTWKDVEQERGTAFMRHARMKEAQSRLFEEKHPSRFRPKKGEYPGDFFFQDIPEGLVRHIATHDAPIEDQESMKFFSLARAIWDKYGPILRYIEFFTKDPTPTFMCFLTRDFPEVLGVLPEWLRQFYEDAMLRFFEGGDLRCGPAVGVCAEIVRRNRGFTHMQKARDDNLREDLQDPTDAPPEDISQIAAKIRNGELADRASIVVQFIMDAIGDHVFTIMRLRDPTYKRTVMRDFVCQAYIYQNALIVEEIDDVPKYLERIAALRTETDPDKFLLEYDRLFQVRISLAPLDNAWIQDPTAWVLRGDKK